MNVNNKNNNGWTALIYAAANNHESMVSLLIDRGADINSKNSNGNTALDIAIDKYYPNIVSIIQQVNINFINS